MINQGEFPDADDLDTAFGEIDTDPGKEVGDADDSVALSDTLVSTPSVIADEALGDVDDEWAKAQIGKMNDGEQLVLKTRIEKTLAIRKARGLKEVVDIVRECMPDGVRKPELCDKDSSRVVEMAEANGEDSELVIDFDIMGMPNKVIVGERGVRIYVSFGPKYVIYAK